MTSELGISKSTLFVFIDESGNLDFSSNGTKHFVMAGVSTVEPVESSRGLQELKYSLLETGYDLIYFRASKDLDKIREQVFSHITKNSFIKSHVIFGEKIRAPDGLRFPSKFHGHFAREFMKVVLRDFFVYDIEAVVVIFDHALTKGQHDEFYIAFKQELKQSNKPFRIFFHPITSDFNGQVADYIAWSKFRGLETGDDRYWEKVSHSLGITSERIF